LPRSSSFLSTEERVGKVHFRRLHRSEPERQPMISSDMTEDERAIRELVEKWMDASRAGDVPAILDLMTDDVLFMTPAREPFGKQEFRSISEAMKDAAIDGRASVQELEVAGE